MHTVCTPQSIPPHGAWSRRLGPRGSPRRRAQRQPGGPRPQIGADPGRVSLRIPGAGHHDHARGNRAWVCRRGFALIFVDSNVPMYLVGSDHPHNGDARRLLEPLVSERERLATDAAVFQEILPAHLLVRSGIRFRDRRRACPRSIDERWRTWRDSNPRHPVPKSGRTGGGRLFAPVRQQSSLAGVRHVSLAADRRRTAAKAGE
jgi:hypothetical protein